MSAAIPITPSRTLRDEIERRGGGEATRCYQCATCSGVCELATPGRPFPRQQMLWAQWGLADRLLSDPAIWLCHQCNDCTARCPRDARPGDVIQALRALAIEEAGAPRSLARLVGRAGATWPLLLGLPVLLWVVYIQAVNGFAATKQPLVYGDLVPVWMIYTVFLPAAAFAVAAAAVGARRCWTAWGREGTRSGGVLAGLGAVAMDVLRHRRFASCGAARPRRLGHLLLFWGFAGALVTTTLLGILMDLFGVKTPLPMTHPVKLLGNLSAVLLAAGTALLLRQRIGHPDTAGRSRAFDNFFAALVVLVVLSGIGAELARLALPPPVAVAIYVLHLGTVLSLFLTFPFSKFAHALYRTLALAHERVTAERRPS